MNNFFCPLPWNHLMFKNGDKVQACCETYQDQFKPAETIADTANDPIMRKLRLELLDPDLSVTAPKWRKIVKRTQRFTNRAKSIGKYR